MELILIFLIVLGTIWLVFYLIELIADIFICILGLGAIILTLIIADKLRMNFGQTCLLAVFLGFIVGMMSIPLMPYSSFFGNRFSHKIINKTKKLKAKDVVDRILDKE